MLPVSQQTCHENAAWAPFLWPGCGQVAIPGGCRSLLLSIILLSIGIFALSSVFDKINIDLQLTEMHS